ncbi:MAG: hypothetical protein ACRERC_20575 [Candidatus Binatia bacterium]
MRSALLMGLLAVVALASAAQAQVTVIDDFESYANSAALQATWVAIAPLPAASVTLDPAGITFSSMSIAYDVSTGTNAVEITFGADQDYTLRTTIRIIYEVTAGSNNEDVVLELRDNANTVLVSAVAPNGTGAGESTWEVNLVPFSNLAAVRKIRLAITDDGDMSGTGTILFDDINVSSGTYSTCRSCHGEFIGQPYVAFTDGAVWNPDLHDIHRYTMLNFDCKTCHTLPAYFPVFIGKSDGGTGLPGIGCLGCHGREEDIGHDTISSGRGAGLNQHHHRAGVTECAKCHSDADPANYEPVGENVRPAYYLAEPAHPAKPTNPCSASERFVSLVEGLDNDGDQLYETLDPDCRATAAPALDNAALVALFGLLLGVGFWRLRLAKRAQTDIGRP